jgi:hypothetical protein
MTTATEEPQALGEAVTPAAADISGLQERRAFAEAGKKVLLTEIGTVGLDISGGRVRESRLQNFKGISRAKVIREMSETDAIVKGLLANYSLLGRAAEKTVSPGGESAEDEAAALHIEECLDDMELSWTDNLSAMFSMLAFGYSIHEVNYKFRNGSDPDPVITELGEEIQQPTSKFEDGKMGWAGWPIRLQETLDRWKTDDNGRVQGVYQRAKTFRRTEVFLPIEKLLHFRTTAKGGNPEGESLLESAYRSWYFKRNYEEILGIGVKRDLTGLLTMAVPKDWSIWSEAQAGKRRELEELVGNLQRDEYEGLVHPDDVTPTLLQSGGQRQFDILALLRSLWLEIAIATLTDFALIGHEAIGARSLKEEAGRTFRIALQSYLDGIAEHINRFAIPPLVRMNGFAVTAMPTLGFSTVDVPQVDQVIDSLVKLANAGAEVFPNQEVTETIFGMLRLPTADLEENLEESEKRRDEFLASGGLFGPPKEGEPGGQQEEEEEEQEEEAT